MALEVKEPLILPLMADMEQLKRQLSEMQALGKKAGDRTGKAAGDGFGKGINTSWQVAKGVLLADITKFAAKLALVKLPSMAFGAGKGIVQFYKDASAAASVQELAEAKLEAALRATNNAIGMTREELVALAAEYQKNSTVGDELVINAEALMLVFRSVSKDVFPQAMQAAIDLSSTLGTDLNSSVMQIGKALEDPATGLTMLRRAGVTFTQSQTKVIKSLADSGDLLGAQRLILDELSAKYAGQAKAATNVFAGAVMQLKNSISDLQEETGVYVNRGLTPMVKQLNEIAQSKEAKGFFADIGLLVGETGIRISTLTKKVLILNDTWRQIKAGKGSSEALQTGAFETLFGWLKIQSKGLMTDIGLLIQEYIYPHATKVVDIVKYGIAEAFEGLPGRLGYLSDQLKSKTSEGRAKRLAADRLETEVQAQTNARLMRMLPGFSQNTTIRNMVRSQVEEELRAKLYPSYYQQALRETQGRPAGSLADALRANSAATREKSSRFLTGQAEKYGVQEYVGDMNRRMGEADVEEAERLAALRSGSSATTAATTAQHGYTDAVDDAGNAMEAAGGKARSFFQIIKSQLDEQLSAAERVAKPKAKERADRYRRRADEARAHGRGDEAEKWEERANEAIGGETYRRGKQRAKELGFDENLQKLEEMRDAVNNYLASERKVFQQMENAHSAEVKQMQALAQRIQRLERIASGIGA